MKTSLVTAFIILLIVIPVVGIVTILLSSSEGNNSEVLPEDRVPQVVFPPSTPSVPIENQNNTITIQGVGNEVVEVANIALLPEAKDVGEGMYAIGGESYAESKPYSLLFNQVEGSFAISLESFPLSAAREIASQDLLRLLNISPEQACTINVYIGVAVVVDETFGGQNLGLSYCPNAVEL
jgi:hypothetical protein